MSLTVKLSAFGASTADKVSDQLQESYMLVRSCDSGHLVNSGLDYYNIISL